MHNPRTLHKKIFVGQLIHLLLWSSYQFTKQG